MPSTTRHAVSRQTGATTWARKDGDAWRVTCLNHNADTTVPNRGTAWTTSSHPATFCPKCKSIDAGKTARLTAGRLDLPKAKPAKKATARPARKTAAAKRTPAKRTTKKAAK